MFIKLNNCDKSVEVDDDDFKLLSTFEYKLYASIGSGIYIYLVKEKKTITFARFLLNVTDKKFRG